MKVFVAVPAYDGKIGCDTVRALLNEQALAGSLGCEMAISFLPGGSLITHARNHCASDFLASDADRMFFLDADVSFEPGSLIKTALRPQDFVGGCYRYKDPNEGYPVGWLQDRAELQADLATGLLEVEALPGGFLSLSRDVFQRLREAYPGRSYGFFGHEFWAYFHAPPGCGEDGTFSAEWRGAGGQVWLDPELTLTHHGGFPSFTGNIGEWLRARPHVA